MILLGEFTVLRPEFGLIVWSTIFFLLFWFLIGKFAFKPIAEALKKRESDIQDALDKADEAKKEMANLNAENEKILANAREERTAMLKEGKEMRDSMIADAKGKAKEEADKIITSAKNEIENQKNAAIAELKNTTGKMAVDIAEKLVKAQLSEANSKESLINKLIDEVKLN